MARMPRIILPKTPTSKGWVKWEKWDGKTMKRILFFMQWVIHSAVMWLSCQSHIKRRGLPSAFSLVAGSKPHEVTSKPPIIIVILAGIHWRDIFSPLKIITGEIKLPVAQIYSSAVNHSWRPGFAWNFLTDCGIENVEIILAMLHRRLTYN